MSSATETIRTMLDERGVEWTEPNNKARSHTTYWTAGALRCIAVEFNDGMVSIASSSDDITPEQAVDATLGRGTCKQIETEEGLIVCSECGAPQSEDYTCYYCWCCGRKVRA